MYRLVRIDNKQYLVSDYYRALFSVKAEAVGQATGSGQKVTKQSIIEIGDCLKSKEEIIKALDIYRGVCGEFLSTDYLL